MGSFSKAYPSSRPLGESMIATHGFRIRRLSRTNFGHSSPAKLGSVLRLRIRAEVAQLQVERPGLEQPSDGIAKSYRQSNLFCNTVSQRLNP